MTHSLKTSSYPVCEDVEILEELGVGGSAVTYKVLYEGTPACLKVGLKSSSIELFRRETKILKSLNGAGGAPRVMTVSKDKPQFLMSFVEGKTLYDLAEEIHSPLRWLKILEAVVESVDEVHERDNSSL